MKRTWGIGLALIMLLGLVLRVYHLHDPILDHPAWRQGDEAAIARNFFELRNNIFYPQTDYDGPPPNYVELELQIVPYAAAQLYRFFGVHEIFARLLVIAFSLGTIPLVYMLGSALYSRRAGLIAATIFAIAPGAVYYGRAIIPESDMLFFSVGALCFWWYFLGSRSARDFCLASAFAALAVLAKPPAVVILAPMLASWFVRAREGDGPQESGSKVNGPEENGPQGPLLQTVLLRLAPLALVIICLAPAWVYIGHLHRIAEWHWATGITSRHVVPALVAALTHPAQALPAVQGTLALSRMLATTILGPVLFGCLILSALVQPRDASAARSAFFGAWFVSLAVYAFAVVNVERVDYYLMPFVPFAVLYVGGGLDHLLELVGPQGMKRRTALALGVALFFATYSGMLEIHPYYTWSRAVFSSANEVRGALEPGALIVMGHYDPSVLYTIGHRGWEEDPTLWTVPDMTSAMSKGARYFVAVEVPRLRANRELYAFLQRYARVPIRSGWQVYDLRSFAR